MTRDEPAAELDDAPVGEHLRRIGADDALLAAIRELAAGAGGRPARVVRADRIRVRVSDGIDVVRSDPDRSRVLDPDTGRLGLPVVGDWVAVSSEAAPAVLAVLPRHGRLVRRDPGAARPQLIASGIDVVLVTVPLDRPVSVARLERELVIAYGANAIPVVLLTKVDSGGDADAARAELASATAGIEVMDVSATLGVGIEQVRHHIGPGRTGVLLGPSGAGKSTLANVLLGVDVHAVGAVRGSDHKGRHVTAFRGLHPVPGGGALIDTPGLRALALWDAHDGLDRAFPEITDAARSCRFADCAHTDEPGCGVAAAAEAGTIDPDRLARYRLLAEELAEAGAEAERAERSRRRRQDRGLR